MLDLDQAIRERHSTRMFLRQPVPRELVNEALALAQYAPSNSNIQPWHMVFASGASRDHILDAPAHIRLRGRSRLTKQLIVRRVGRTQKRQRPSATTMAGPPAALRNPNEHTGGDLRPRRSSNTCSPQSAS